MDRAVSMSKDLSIETDDESLGQGGVRPFDSSFSGKIESFNLV